MEMDRKICVREKNLKIPEKKKKRFMQYIILKIPEGHSQPDWEYQRENRTRTESAIWAI